MSNIVHLRYIENNIKKMYKNKHDRNEIGRFNLRFAYHFNIYHKCFLNFYLYPDTYREIVLSCECVFESACIREFYE